MTALPKMPNALAEYFELERSSEARYQYLDGAITLMAGASRHHEMIVVNAGASLNTQLRDRRCEVFGSNLRIKVDVHAYFYADLSAACDEAQFAQEKGLEALTNPTVLIEVLSPSTALFDRTGKFWRYQVLESLQEYVLIAQEQPVIEIYRRISEGWLYSRVEGLEASARLESIRCSLPLAEVYRRVTFPPSEASS